MHSTQKSVIINKAICRFKHEEKEDEFHAKRMESIQPLKWKEQKETVSMSAQHIYDTGQRIYGNGGWKRGKQTVLLSKTFPVMEGTFPVFYSMWNVSCRKWVCA